jgi:hypothetical protein
MARLPNLIIAGVVKGGSTSLYTYLAQHPQFAASDVKETAFFRAYHFDPATVRFEDYARHFVHAKDEPFVFEATPGYINGGAALARYLNERLPDLRVVIVLREPVERFRSYFDHHRGLLNLPKNADFGAYIDRCEAAMAGGATPKEVERGLYGGLYADKLEGWMDEFGDRLWIGFFDDLKRDASGFTDAICDWLGARRASDAGVSFGVENQSALPKNEALHRLAMSTYKRFEPLLRANHGLKSMIRDAYRKVNAAPKGPSRATDADVARLRAFYAEPNVRLRRLLAERRPDIALPAWLTAAPVDRP